MPDFYNGKSDLIIIFGMNKFKAQNKQKKPPFNDL